MQERFPQEQLFLELYFLLLNTEVDAIGCYNSKSKSAQELVVTTEIVQRSIISRTFVPEVNDYKHSELSGKQKDLIVDLFKVSPDVKKIFQSLYNYNPNDDRFYELVAKHSLRVFGMLNKLVKEVCYFKVYECMRLFYRLNENSLIISITVNKI